MRPKLTSEFTSKACQNLYPDEGTHAWTNIIECIYPNLPMKLCFHYEADVKGESHTKFGIYHSGKFQSTNIKNSS